ncbi:nucleotide-sugar transporter-domain-containing protein [Corynascus novoguineensis]|uniref:Nucleotide-sugar transporter-domain-containing protein n=1 Tax=Corynascus novoguineensis TaxID=1126955 RepID=A0AAN7HJ03_9PEZI|nr:nucleotide-sugar transporter-domain-containing protein [Corynascus novoguineensis]
MAVAQSPKIATGPTLLGMPMKQASLLTLMLQNSALILIMHYSRIMTPPGDHRYFTSTAVLLNEVIKLAISLSFSMHEVSRSLAPQTPVTVLLEQIYNQVFSGDGWKLAIPAVLYTLENTLQYVALSNLDAVHFQLLYQLKIITTAIFMVILLGRSFGIRRWLSLIVLTAGVAIVSLPSSNAKDLTLDIHDFSDHFFPRSVHELGQFAGGVAEAARELTKRGVIGLSNELTKRSATYEGIADDLDSSPKMNYSVGLTAVLVAAVVSGLTGVYFEKILKESTTPASVWTRNIQLSFYSLFPAFIVGVVINDGEEIAKHGFFDGYNSIVWTAIVLQAIGGILASLCINYADNIAKNFATSISIVLSFLFSVFFFGFQVNASFLVGTALVLAATYAYSLPERKRTRPPPITIASYEKTTIEGTPRYVDQDRLSVNPLDSALARGSAGGGGGSLGISSSRPASPMMFHERAPSARGKRGDD